MQAAPLVHSTFPPEPPGGAAYQRAVTATAAAVLRFEAEVKPGIAAEAHPEPSLEDLRLATPALRPVGCWWSGCAPLPAVHVDAAALAAPITAP